MKHKSEEKKENKRLKLEHQASSNFYQSQVLAQRKALIELLTPHPS
jgi:transposase-like protein